MKARKELRFLFAAGGTGGHLFPAIAVAEQIMKMEPKSKILFVGTKNKIEAKVVPQYGYNFEPIWISGIARKFSWKNFSFPIKLFISLMQSLKINMKYQPDVSLGAGAYVSGPVLWAADMVGSKIILMEQNSYPGVTNRILESLAEQVYVSFQESEEYFYHKEKLVFSGNPVRITLQKIDKATALQKFNLNSDKKTILILGGSLGAKSINNSTKSNLEKLLELNINIIWQTGEIYYENYKSLKRDRLFITPFLEDMSAAYSASDIVVARAGATTIAEAAYLELAVIFIPSVNVSANHQYKNAKALENSEAAVLIEDKDCESKLFKTIDELLKNENRLYKLKNNIKNFSKPDAAETIAINAIRLAHGN